LIFPNVSDKKPPTPRKVPATSPKNLWGVSRAMLLNNTIMSVLFFSCVQRQDGLIRPVVQEEKTRPQYLCHAS
jgi:hypothetical protein